MNANNTSLFFLKEQLIVIQSNINQFFLVICGIFVLFMQAGFAFLEAGSVRSKNTTNIIMKNVLDLFIGSLSYYCFGFAFAFGEGNGFIGHNHFFASNIHYESPNVTGHGLTYDDYFAFWFYQFGFAATASTIISGAMAERTEFATYMVYSIFLTGFVYPVVAHWGWSRGGWLATGAGTGLSYKDFAGSGVVHVTGGTAALVGAAILGPRIGRFNPGGSTNDIPGHSVTVTALGGFILFIGFLAFNAGSQLSISSPGDGAVVARATMNTLLGGSTSSITAMVLYKATDAIRGKDHFWSLIIAINGGLAGMVSMCATCNDLYAWSAVVIGATAGLAFIGWHRLILRIRIDDPLDAVAVHLGGGLCGILMGPIFAIKGLKVNGEYVGGIVHGGHYYAFRNFAWNMLGALTIMAWTASITSLMFGIMKFLRALRVSEAAELNGLDRIKHGEPAYPYQRYSIDNPAPPFKNKVENGVPSVEAEVKATSDFRSSSEDPSIRSQP